MVTLAKATEPPKDSGDTPDWLKTSINRKRGLMPITFPVHDIVSQYVAKAPKAKKVKSTA